MLLWEEIHAFSNAVQCQCHERQRSWENFSSLKERLEKPDNKMQCAIFEWLPELKKLQKTLFGKLEKCEYLL